MTYGFWKTWWTLCNAGAYALIPLGLLGILAVAWVFPNRRRVWQERAETWETIGGLVSPMEPPA